MGNMMYKSVLLRKNILILIVSVGTYSIGALQAQQHTRFIQIADDFSAGSGGWLPEFTNYGLDEGGQQRLAEIRVLPGETGSQGKGYYLQAVNHSDDIFTFLKRPLELQDGIEPGASYEVEFLIDFASSAPTGCVGVGGSPGDDVYLKVGASAGEPVAILVQQGFRLNLDEGGHTSSGHDATVAGTIANGLQDCMSENPPFVLVERRQKHASLVTASQSGRLWLFVGTDSGYEGLNQLYYARIVVSITRVDGDAARRADSRPFDRFG